MSKQQVDIKEQEKVWDDWLPAGSQSDNWSLSDGDTFKYKMHWASQTSALCICDAIAPMAGDEVCDNGGDGYVDGDGDAIAPLVGDVEGMQGPTR